MEFGPIGYSHLYLPEATQVRHTPIYGLLDGADFALLKMDDTPAPWNWYETSTPLQLELATQEPVSVFIDTIASDLASGPVSVVCSRKEVRSGFLLEGSSLFMNPTGVWETRKIHLDLPLSKLSLSNFFRASSLLTAHKIGVTLVHGSFKAQAFSV